MTDTGLELEIAEILASAVRPADAGRVVKYLCLVRGVSVEFRGPWSGYHYWDVNLGPRFDPINHHLIFGDCKNLEAAIRKYLENYG